MPIVYTFESVIARCVYLLLLLLFLLFAFYICERILFMADDIYILIPGWATDCRVFGIELDREDVIGLTVENPFSFGDVVNVGPSF